MGRLQTCLMPLESSDAESNVLYESIEPLLPLGLPFVQTAVSEHWFDWPALPDLVVSKNTNEL